MRISTLLFSLLFVLTACPKPVDKITMNRVVDRGRQVPDLEKACALGEAFAHPIAAAGTKKRPPKVAMVVAETTAGLCWQVKVWEAELGEARARNSATTGAAKTAEIREARIVLERANTAAAQRFYRSWLFANEAFGEIGTEGKCKVRKRDEPAYLLGIVSGMLAMLHDGAGGGHVDVPLDTLARVSRGAKCLDDEAWWHAPSALETAQWATIPGSGPADVDAWERLEDVATKGDASGVRVARALQALVANNSGRTDVLEHSIEAHAASLAETPLDDEWALLDEYARRVTGQQSDLLWTNARGHRTPTFGELPREPEPVPDTPSEPDPFGEEDPFGE